MEEILLLQQQLMAVQNSSTKYKLANRNVIEIVDMLIKRHGLELYFTLDGRIRLSIGREFITPQHLDGVIRDTVGEMGKVSMVELPNLLNMDVSIIEARVDGLVKKGSLKNVRGV